MKSKYLTEIEKLEQQIQELKQKEEKLQNEVPTLVQRFLDYDEKLKVRLNEIGVWEIKGEYISYIGTVSGSLLNAIKWAVQQNGFFQWGSWGNIEKIKVIEV